MRRFAYLYAGCAFLASLLLTVNFASAQTAEQTYARVKPFVDEQTFLVVHVDLNAVDVNSIRDWISDQLRHFKEQDAKNNAGKLAQQFDQMQNGLAMGTVASQRWLDQVKASGGRHAFMLVSPHHVRNQRSPVFVFPIEGNADAKVLADTIFPFQRNQRGPRPQGMPVAEQVGDAVVFGEPESVQKAREIKPAERADLLNAIVASGDAPIQAAYAANVELGKAMGEKMPQLPPQLGGGDTATVAGDVKWAAASIQLPPKVSLNAVAQAASPESADRVEGLIRTLTDRPAPGMEAAWVNLLKLLAPQRQGERFTLALTQEQIIEQVAPAFSAAVAQARQHAMRVASMSNMRQLTITMTMVAQNNNGQYPADIQAMVNAQPGMQQVLRNPSRPEKEVGFIYIKPANDAGKGGHAATHVVFYEDHDKFGEGINVAFLDGHVEYMNNEAQFKQLMDETKKRNRQLEEGL